MKALDEFVYPPGSPQAGKRAGIVQPALLALLTAAFVAISTAGAILERQSRTFPRPQRCPNCPHRWPHGPHTGVAR